MPKTKGMTSIEVAVLVGIILIVAAAVGWYVYTTFLASAAANPQLAINDVKYFNNGTLLLHVTNLGPGRATIRAVELGGTVVNTWIVLAQGETRLIRLNVGGGGVEGTLLTGRVVLGHGGSIPFTVRVLRAQ